MTRHAPAITGIGGPSSVTSIKRLDDRRMRLDGAHQRLGRAG
jgi:hypothetical protein